MKKEGNGAGKNTKKGGDSAGAVTRRFDFWSIVILVSIILCLIFIVYPFSRLFINSFSSGKAEGFTFYNYLHFFQKKYYRRALFNSLKVCSLVTVLATLLGVPMAYVGTRFNIYLKKTINVMIVLSMLSPPFIGAYTWILLLGRAGFFTRILQTAGIHFGSIYGFSGIILVFTLKLFPLVYLYVSGALSTVDSSLEEAAENLGVHGLKRIFTITLPVILPTILSSALMVFMSTLADFGTPKLIGEGYKVLPVAIYEEFMSEIGSDTGLASSLSVIIVTVALLILWVQKRVVDKRNYQMSSLRPPETVSLPFVRRILATLAVFTVSLLSVLPQITVMVTSFLKTQGPLFVRGWTLDSYRAIIFKLGRNIRNTFVFSGIAILVIVLLGMLISYSIVRKRSKITGLLDMMVMAPYVIPGSVIGISMILAFNTGPVILTGTSAILILSYVIRKTPYTLRSSVGILYQMDPSIEEASISLGVSPMKTFLKITARMMAAGVLSGAVLSFISTINELSSTIILYTGKTATISVAIFGEINKNVYGSAAALSTILTAATILCLLVFYKLSGGKSVVG